jgi:hypothetical protein
VTDTDASEYLILDRRRALHAFDWGALAMVGVSLFYGLMIYPVGLTWGLAAVAVGGGWLIGKAVLRGAWGGRVGQPSRRLQALAVVVSLIAWQLSFAVAYLAAELLLVSDFPLADRLTLAGFWTYVNGIASLPHAVAIAAFVIMGWRSARWKPRPARQPR